MDAEQIAQTGVTSLTARWLRAVPDDGRALVLSGLGLWPLLAMLSGLADGPARAELAAAAGVEPDEGLTAGRELLEVLALSADLQTALGLWTRADLPLSPDALRDLAPGTLGTLTGDAAVDGPALDGWVAERTGGLLDRMPLTTDSSTLLVLASALAVRTKWWLPFQEYPHAPKGFGLTEPVLWIGRQDDDLATLRRYDREAGPLTVVTVAGTNDVDVLLALAEPARTRDDVLTAVLATLDEPGDFVDGAALLAEEEPAPGVTVFTSTNPQPFVWLSLPAFEVTREHDLLEDAAAVGLEAASDTGRGHFPGLSPQPLAISEAKQSVLARFSATGFEAAAVTAFGMVAGSVPQPGAKALSVTLDRPFGFVAVHRPTGLPIVLGWVTNDALLPHR